MNTFKPVYELTEQLIAEPSITPVDGQCQPLINEQLSAAGFEIHDYSVGPVTNTFAEIRGNGANDGPTTIFAGHTDVVPVKDQLDWQSDPFTLTERDGYLFGRGTTDMKGGLAAMVTAARKFVNQNPNFGGTIGFAITSFEEIANDKSLDVNALGTNHIVQQLKADNYPVDYVVVGEPSSEETLGDTVKNGRRGTASISLEVTGVGGHTAYASPKLNPLMVASRLVGSMLEQTWTDPNSFELIPDTTLNFTVPSGATTQASVPDYTIIDGNMRFPSPLNGELMTKQADEQIKDAFDEYVATLPPALASQLSWETRYTISGEPFMTPSDSPLAHMSQLAITEVTGIKTNFSSSGGTSDGRYLAVLKNRTGQPAQIMEIGTPATTIHKSNESIKVGDLEKLETIYYNLLEKIFANNI